MAESSTIMGLVAAFIAVAIMLGVGIQILGNVQTSTNCNSLPGGTHPGTNTPATLVNNSPTNSTSWALSCFNNNTSIQNAYTLLIVIMIVIAAVAILFVVRML